LMYSVPSCSTGFSTSSLNPMTSVPPWPS